MGARAKSFVSIAAALIIGSALNAQTIKFNEAYNPTQVAKRLSYENFRDLKMLQIAIINFGGGQEEVDRLIDQYSEASALYFQGRYEESANLFSDNQKDIFHSAKRITVEYKKVAEKLLIDSTKKTIKDDLRNAMKNKPSGISPDVFLSKARFSVNMANDYYDRFKDAKVASPMSFIKAIFYYRRAKDSMLSLVKTMETDKEKKDQFMDQYKKDIFDNDNKVYQSKEKNK